jgi:hypothetical protein
MGSDVCGPTRSLNEFKRGIELKHAIVRLIALLVCMVTAPTVLEGIRASGREFVSPLPATDLTLNAEVTGLRLNG